MARGYRRCNVAAFTHATHLGTYFRVHSGLTICNVVKAFAELRHPVKTNRGARECVKMPLPTAPSAFMSRNGKHTRGLCAMGRVLAFSTLTCDKSHIYKGLFFGPWPEVHCTGHHSVAAFDGGVMGMGIVQCFTLFSSFLLPNRRHQK